MVRISSSSDKEYGLNSRKEQLNALLPYGPLATRKWLIEQGFSSHSLDNGVKSGKLLQLASGVYSQFTTNLRWEGVVASIQRMQATPLATAVHVGGVSALALSGLAQYISPGNRKTVQLYSTTKLPSWVSRVETTAMLTVNSSRRLWPESLMQTSGLLRSHEFAPNLPPLYFSCPEKAILEVIADLPDKFSFEHADELMQSLVNLSPGKLDQVLQACLSIKVKRLFLWLAERHQYPWLARLNVSSYELGSGKRVIAECGALNRKYLITIPRSMSSQ
ncbi:type IV toxin-antitoxin system AbiEi family antitoxin domain-containing protein [Endozoicomonas acroporae]|uniref:type IV toxin-antitoxin system AbiEi family antitoxin domain-containing protein n=1 Tax=Endozoicomonas acroporae TaxID=1701104 RepID=UPI000C7686F0|nr:type IV toxin-antitoxin system AbiEi family antitoxin domain-containing protein [Endozoicomonas acroporae]